MTDQGCQLIDLRADRIRDHCPFVAWRMVYRRRLPAVVAAGGLALRQDAVRVGGKVISLLITHHSAFTESLFPDGQLAKTVFMFALGASSLAARTTCQPLNPRLQPAKPVAASKRAKIAGR